MKYSLPFLLFPVIQFHKFSLLRFPWYIFMSFSVSSHSYENDKYSVFVLFVFVDMRLLMPDISGEWWTFDCWHNWD
jgi:hypothetical protein